jgi:DNA-binding MarR family transcriptional regulator
MKLEWMGRYRELMGLLSKYVNIFGNFGNKAVAEKLGFRLTSQQWQTLECIIEYEDENKNMMFMANKIGLKKSTFSKFIKVLVNHGLVERYQLNDNRKDIILKPSDKGRIYYKDRSQIILESAWKEAFAVLDKLSDESLAIVVDFMTKIIDDLDPKNNKVIELFKLL